MIKPKKYDWKDSNLALFGSDVEKGVKKDSANAEPAWHGSGQEVGLEIWRVVKFKIEKWAKEDYGKFFSGDSYIVLNTYKNPDEEDLEYDLHFWIGKYSTQDEYGTVAYKTVELDTFHNDKPVQHREIQSNESTMFSSYFPNGISLMKGGADSGFKHVKPTEYKPRLFQFVGTTYANTVIKEVGLYKQSLNKEDVFVLDNGLQIYQINTPNCDKDEKVKAMHHCLKIKSERCGRPKVETIDDDPLKHDVVAGVLGDKNKKEKAPAPGPHSKKLIRVSDDSGTLKMDTVAEGSFEVDDLDPKDVFIVDLEKSIYVWVGEGASAEEKKNGMSYAHTYVSKTDRPLRSISVVNQRRAHHMYADMKA
ncbi:gelsolin-like protein 2 [Bolinopsis microptera]|uniref:gelsolin-like protein 2 n=1 Tax=Bolinopsis microptera TaxID=2820187 RepID=UPI003079F82B